jgi:hypothetical protein
LVLSENVNYLYNFTAYGHYHSLNTTSIFNAHIYVYYFIPPIEAELIVGGCTGYVNIFVHVLHGHFDITLFLQGKPSRGRCIFMRARIKASYTPCSPGSAAPRCVSQIALRTNDPAGIPGSPDCRVPVLKGSIRKRVLTGMAFA